LKHEPVYILDTFIYEFNKPLDKKLIFRPLHVAVYELDI